MLGWFLSYSLTPQQKLEQALKEKADLENQLREKDNLIAELQKILIPEPPKPPKLIQVLVPVLAIDAEQLPIKPGMTAEERSQVFEKIRAEKKFRIGLLPPPVEILTGMAAVMNELKKIDKVQE